MTISIDEFRRRLEKAKALYKGNDPEDLDKTIDALMVSVKEKYGAEVPVVDALKLLRKLPLASTEAASAVETTKPSPQSQIAPDGVSFEWTPAGFLLRARCGSLIGGGMMVVFAGVLCAIPFVVFGGMIRDLPTYEGLGFWLACAFLGCYAGGVLYVGAQAAVALAGEIRIAKAGDNGEIFTGVGKVGWTHRVRWSDFHGAGERTGSSESSRGFSSHTTYYVGLNGTSKGYRFGSELTTEQRAFVIGFLREHVFRETTAPTPSAAK